MYRIEDYLRMAASPARSQAYLSAIEKCVEPGHVVLEIGTGVGLFAIAAAHRGARKVYAVELNDAVSLGPELARAAGVADRIEFFHGSVWDLPRKEPADVVFFDLRGSYPLYGDALATAAGTLDRWLAPEGKHFPQKDELFAALVDFPALRATQELAAGLVSTFGLRSNVLQPVLANTLLHDSPANPVLAEHLLTDPFRWGEIEYRKPAPPSIAAEGELVVRRGATANALALWFRATLLPGIGFDSMPAEARAANVYSRLLLPLEREVRVEAGDRVHATLRALASGDEFGWNVTIRGASGVTFSAKQSTFLSRPISIAAMVASADATVPKLNDAGRRLNAHLAALDGKRTLAQLAAELSPTSAPGDVERTLEDLRRLAVRYGT